MAESPQSHSSALRRQRDRARRSSYGLKLPGMAYLADREPTKWLAPVPASSSHPTYRVLKSWQQRTELYRRLKV